MRSESTPDGFDEMFEDMFPQAHAAAFRILGDSAAAEDAAAEAFARALARWRRVRDHPRREAWLLRVTVNVAIDMTRTFSRMTRMKGQPEGRSTHHTDTVSTRLDLVTALRSLPRRQREVVALRYLTDLPESDVAACLGISVGTVRTHAHRGIAALRSRFDPQPTPGEATVAGT